MTNVPAAKGEEQRKSRQKSEVKREKRQHVFDMGGCSP
jgi:hypothetical protein